MIKVSTDVNLREDSSITGLYYCMIKRIEDLLIKYARTNNLSDIDTIVRECTNSKNLSDEDLISTSVLGSLVLIYDKDGSVQLDFGEMDLCHDNDILFVQL